MRALGHSQAVAEATDPGAQGVPAGRIVPPLHTSQNCPMWQLKCQ